MGLKEEHQTLLDYMSENDNFTHQLYQYKLDVKISDLKKHLEVKQKNYETIKDMIEANKKKRKQQPFSYKYETKQKTGNASNYNHNASTASNYNASTEQTADLNL